MKLLGTYKISKAMRGLTLQRLVLCAIWTAVGASAHGTDYFVDGATGADANPGTQASPWRTIGFAGGNSSVQAGDTVHVVAGSYTGEGVITITRSGSSGNRVTFRSQTRRAAVTRGFNINGAYVRLEGFDITNGGANANGISYNAGNIEIVDNSMHQMGRFAIIGTQANVTIKDNYLFQVQLGIQVNGANFLVENNEIERLFNYGNLGDADYTRFWGTNGVFRGNYFHGTRPEEIGSAHVDGFQTFAGPGEAHDITWENNIVQDFSQGLEVEGTNSGFRIINNIFVGGSFSAWGIVFDTGVTANSFIAHNVFADITWFGVGVREGSSATIQNNIFYNVAGARSISVDGSSSVTLGNNLIFNSPPPDNPDPTDIIGVDPRFENPAARDFHLRPTSPAIDAGRSLGITQDIEGTPRPLGAGPDIGPYEGAGEPDTENPSTPTGLVATGVSESRVDLSWTASTDNNRVSGYRIYRDGAVVGAPSVPEYSDAGLNASTLYTYQVLAFDSSGNESALSEPANATTLAPDLSAPSVPQNLTARAVSPFRIDVTWVASVDDRGVAGYHLYRDGNLVATTSETTHGDLGLTPATTYQYSVSAFDAAGNESDPAATLAAATTEDAPPLAAGLVAYYGLDEGAGTVATDSTGNGNNGTLSGATWTTEGRHAGAAQFGGQGEKIDLGGLDVAGEALTIALWFKADDFGSSDGRLISKTNSSAEDDHYWMISTFEGQVLRFRLKTGNGGTTTLIAESGVLSSGAWTHVAATYNGSEMALYKDGVQVGAAAKTGALAVSSLVSAALGANPGGDQSFDGSLDEVAIFNRALDVDEIQLLMITPLSGGAPPEPTPSPEPTPTPEPIPTPDDAHFDPVSALDFSNGSLGWLEVNVSGDGSIGFVPGSGLCIFAPETGENVLAWDTPDGQFIEVARNKVYRVRFTMTTNQTAPDEIPIWNILYRNINRELGLVTWGGERWFFDNVGGANGIGQINRDGRTEFEAWVAPTAVATAQWNGDIDPENSAFSTFNGPLNHIALAFRVLDLDSAAGGALGSQFDDGIICLKKIQVDAVDLDQLVVDGAPLFSDSMSPGSNVDVLFTTAGSVIGKDADGLTIELGEPGGVGRALVGYADPSLTGFPREFPVLWNDEELLRFSAAIVDPRPTSGPTPVDVIAMGWQAATNEIGGTDFMFRGQPGGFFDRSGAPRSVQETDGVAQKYMNFFWTHNSTDADPTLLPDANRLRAVLDFFNRDDLGGVLGEGVLSDPLQVRTFAVERIRVTAKPE